MFDAAKGTLTSKGAAILEAAGIDPSKVTPESLKTLNAGIRSSGTLAGASASGAGRMLPYLPRGASNTLNIGNAATGGESNRSDDQN